VIARSCNAYGYDLSPRIIPNTIRSCLRGDPPIIYEGEETKRQYVYVEDLCEALTHLMRRHSYKGVYDIATDDILTQEQVVKTICKYFPISPRLVKREQPILEIKSQSMKIRNFGWKPKHTFSEGIQETIKKFERYGF
jgi:nucleoside-diphosphate-sugar epimerase